MRPKDMQDMSVDAYLETAHLEGLPYGEPTHRIDVNMYQVGGDRTIITDKDKYNLDQHNRYLAETYKPDKPEVWEIDTERADGGYIVDATVVPDTVSIPWSSPFAGAAVQTWYEVTVADDRLSAFIEARVGVAGQIPPSDEHKVFYGRLTLNITFYLRRRESQTLFLTGRGVCCPPPNVPQLIAEFVVHEIALPNQSMPNTRADGMSLLEANKIQQWIGHEMINSLGASGRYARGEVSFTEAQFVSRRIADLIDWPDHPDNDAVQDIAGLKAQVRDKVVRVMPDVRRADVLRMQLQETMDRFELSHEEAIHLRRAALGLEQTPGDPKDRWDPPSRRKEHVIPNVVGFSLDEAARMLQAEDLSVGDVRYQDSEQPTDVVLSQQPESGKTVRGGAKVQLIVATGLTVRIPDVVGKPLTEALRMLREAGLQSEPELEFVKGQNRPKHNVLRVIPSSRTHVTPNMVVRLEVSESNA